MPGDDRIHARRGRHRETPAQSSVSPAPGPQPRASLPGNPDVIRALNGVLKNELTAINQYFLHSRVLADWGLSILAKAEYDQSKKWFPRGHGLVIPNLLDLGPFRNPPGPALARSSYVLLDLLS